MGGSHTGIEIHRGSEAGKGRTRNALWSLEVRQQCRVQWLSVRVGFFVSLNHLGSLFKPHTRPKTKTPS